MGGRGPERSAGPTRVWSSYGGRRREVTVVVGGWRYRRRPEAPRLLVAVGSVMALAGVAAAGAVAATYWWDRGGPVDPLVTGLVYGLGVPSMLLGVVGSLMLARAVPDLWRRQAVEGAVVRRRVAYGEDSVDGYRNYLAIDDGRSDMLVAYPLGREHRTRLGTSPYHHVQTGDVVRLTVAPGYGHVFRVEPRHDADGRPLPPVGALPVPPPGAPVTPQEVSRATALVVRRVEETAAVHDGETVRSWRYALVHEDGLFVAVHLARGPASAAAVVAAAGAGGPTRRKAATLPGAVRHEGGLLVAPHGPVTVGVQWAPLMGLPRGSWSWDEDLARLALTRLAATTDH